MELAAILRRAPGQWGVYAKSLHSGEVIAWQPHAVFPAASTIKVPILAELYRRVEEEGLSLDRTLRLRAEDQVGGSGVLADLTPGTRWRLRDLATLMITVSDNTATNLLIDFLGVESVNRTLRRLEIVDTFLVRRLERLPVAEGPGNRTTASDLSHLMELLAHGRLISRAVSARMVRLLLRCQGPCLIAPPVPGATYVGQPSPMRVAHKSGSLSDARHDTGIVYRSGRGAYVATILAHGAPEPTLRRVGERVGRFLAQRLL
ncbi:MAG: class A beta-lactamase-related serine hydrolase [Firmicutes bacterium]|nr:serine hydrolase [Alicyclobacillaceae bacterium]MCL6497721.1 class A beta-lactamase-related serine hydrolase [Bacillota bacterium]